jgi:hypothetical protein
MIVFLLTTGEGSDGDEWDVKSIHSSREAAEKAKLIYESPQMRPDGTSYNFSANIEEWEVDP